ncbi:MAG: hypothetical protein ACQEQF_00160 [Bacillota bacterium]
MTKRQETIRSIAHRTIANFVENNGLEKLEEKENDLKYFIKQSKITIKNNSRYNEYIDGLTDRSFKMFMTKLEKMLKEKIYTQLLINDMK